MGFLFLTRKEPSAGAFDPASFFPTVVGLKATS